MVKILSIKKNSECNFHGHSVSVDRFWELIEKTADLEVLEKELFIEKGIDFDSENFIRLIETERKKAQGLDFTQIFD